MITKSVIAKFVSAQSTTISAGPITFTKVEPIADSVQNLFTAWQARDIKATALVATIIRQQETSVLTKAQSNLVDELIKEVYASATKGELMQVGTTKLDAAGELAAAMRKANAAARKK
jgi:hypothetical protein